MRSVANILEPINLLLITAFDVATEVLVCDRTDGKYSPKKLLINVCFNFQICDKKKLILLELFDVILIPNRIPSLSVKTMTAQKNCNHLNQQFITFQV